MHSLDMWTGAYMSGFTVEVSSQRMPRGHAQLDLLKLLRLCACFSTPAVPLAIAMVAEVAAVGAQAHDRKNEHTPDFHLPQGCQLHF